MGILQVQNISLSFGDRTLLSNVSFTLGQRARAALAGGNGEGKSTLMKIIASKMQCDTGSITKTKDMRISYLPQSDIVLRNNTVYDEIESGFERFEENLSKQHEIEALLSERNDEKLLVELNNLQEALLDSTYYNRKAVIYSIAKGLGFKDTDLTRKCSEFSGGYQMRIALAKVLAEDPDLMMLDEPTNYLDIEARLWLKAFISKYNGSVFLVCHDRQFMDDTVNEVYELFNSKLTRYSGNYSSYEKQRQMEIETLEKEYEKQVAEIKQTEQFIEKFRYKATKAKQVQSRIKALDKVELVTVPSHLKTIRFTFPNPPHSPNDVVIVNNMTKKYPGLTVFDNFSMLIPKGQRLAVTGHNGIGKSTLLRIIAGKDSDFEGESRLGSGVSVGYYAQDTADSLNLNNTIIEEVLPYGSESQMRSALGAFLFSGDDIYKKISVLSGGERSRLALCKILLQPACLLVLDEPTNHLDINSKDMILNALSSYAGTVVFVSHDSYFISKIATKILYLSEDKPEFFDGDYSYFEWKLSNRLNLNNEMKETQKTSSVPVDRAEANRIKNRINKLNRELEEGTAEIEKIEKQITEVQDLMNLEENYSNPEKIKELVDKKKILEEQKEKEENLYFEKLEELEGYGSK